MIHRDAADRLQAKPALVPGGLGQIREPCAALDGRKFRQDTTCAS